MGRADLYREDSASKSKMDPHNNNETTLKMGVKPKPKFKRVKDPSIASKPSRTPVEKITHFISPSKKQAKIYKMEKSAQCIQRHVRGHLARLRVERIRREIRRKQRAQMKEQKRVDDAASKIQARWKGYRAQWDYELTRDAIDMLQRVARGFLGRLKARRERAALLIQDTWRVYLILTGGEKKLKRARVKSAQKRARERLERRERYRAEVKQQRHRRLGDPSNPRFRPPPRARQATPPSGTRNRSNRAGRKESNGGDGVSNGKSTRKQKVKVARIPSSKIIVHTNEKAIRSPYISISGGESDDKAEKRRNATPNPMPIGAPSMGRVGDRQAKSKKLRDLQEKDNKLWRRRKAEEEAERERLAKEKLKEEKRKRQLAKERENAPWLPNLNETRPKTLAEKGQVYEMSRSGNHWTFLGLKKKRNPFLHSSDEGGDEEGELSFPILPRRFVSTEQEDSMREAETREQEKQIHGTGGDLELRSSPHVIDSLELVAPTPPLQQEEPVQHGGEDYKYGVVENIGQHGGKDEYGVVENIGQHGGKDEYGVVEDIDPEQAVQPQEKDDRKKKKKKKDKKTKTGARDVEKMVGVDYSHKKYFTTKMTSEDRVRGSYDRKGGSSTPQRDRIRSDMVTSPPFLWNRGSRRRGSASASKPFSSEKGGKVNHTYEVNQKVIEQTRDEQFVRLHSVLNTKSIPVRKNSAEAMFYKARVKEAAESQSESFDQPRSQRRSSQLSMSQSQARPTSQTVPRLPLPREPTEKELEEERKRHKPLKEIIRLIHMQHSHILRDFNIGYHRRRNRMKYMYRGKPWVPLWKRPLDYFDSPATNRFCTAEERMKWARYRLEVNARSIHRMVGLLHLLPVEGPNSISELLKKIHTAHPGLLKDYHLGFHRNPETHPYEKKFERLSYNPFAQYRDLSYWLKPYSNSPVRKKLDWSRVKAKVNSNSPKMQAIERKKLKKTGGRKLKEGQLEEEAVLQDFFQEFLGETLTNKDALLYDKDGNPIAPKKVEEETNELSTFGQWNGADDPTGGLTRVDGKLVVDSETWEENRENPLLKGLTFRHVDIEFVSQLELLVDDEGRPVRGRNGKLRYVDEFGMEVSQEEADAASDSEVDIPVQVILDSEGKVKRNDDGKPILFSEHEFEPESGLKKFLVYADGSPVIDEEGRILIINDEGDVVERLEVLTDTNGRVAFDPFGFPVIVTSIEKVLLEEIRQRVEKLEEERKEARRLAKEEKKKLSTVQVLYNEDGTVARHADGSMMFVMGRNRVLVDASGKPLEDAEGNRMKVTGDGITIASKDEVPDTEVAGTDDWDSEEEKRLEKERKRKERDEERRRKKEDRERRKNERERLLREKEDRRRDREARRRERRASRLAAGEPLSQTGDSVTTDEEDLTPISETEATPPTTPSESSESEEGPMHGPWPEELREWEGDLRELHLDPNLREDHMNRVGAWREKGCPRIAGLGASTVTAICPPLDTCILSSARDNETGEMFAMGPRLKGVKIQVFGAELYDDDDEDGTYGDDEDGEFEPGDEEGEGEYIIDEDGRKRFKRKERVRTKPGAKIDLDKKKRLRPKGDKRKKKRGSDSEDDGEDIDDIAMGKNDIYFNSMQYEQARAEACRLVNSKDTRIRAEFGPKSTQHWMQRTAKWWELDQQLKAPRLSS